VHCPPFVVDNDFLKTPRIDGADLPSHVGLCFPRRVSGPFSGPHGRRQHGSQARWIGGASVLLFRRAVPHVARPTSPKPRVAWKT
jgi:hypothetical protein